MRRWLTGAGVVIMLWIVETATVRAEPAFAVRTGYRCSQCHVNRTGGGLRTPFGSIYTQTTLPARVLAWRDGGNLLPADPDARFAFCYRTRPSRWKDSRDRPIPPPHH